VEYERRLGDAAESRAHRFASFEHPVVRHARLDVERTIDDPHHEGPRAVLVDGV
jgi:hypothetical protein